MNAVAENNEPAWDASTRTLVQNWFELGRHTRITFVSEVAVSKRLWYSESSGISCEHILIEGVARAEQGEITFLSKERTTNRRLVFTIVEWSPENTNELLSSLHANWSADRGVPFVIDKVPQSLYPTISDGGYECEITGEPFDHRLQIYADASLGNKW